MDQRIIYLCLLMFVIVNSQTSNPEILSLHITSDIKYRFATTLVTSVVANSDNTSVEAHFEVTLPDAAFITDFVMEIEGKLYPGEINEKEKAKKKYETAKKKGQSAGHIAQQPRRTNRFKVDVNVAAESTVTFNLTYQELLERVYGEYEHIIYIDPGQIVKDFQINVAVLESRDITKVSVPPLRNDIILDSSIEEGTNALVKIDRPTSKSAIIRYSPTEEDQKEQSDQGISGLFVVEYDIERKTDAGDILVVDGYFVHFFAPDGMDPIPKDVLFVLDVSGSMSGKKIQQQKEAMASILKDLHEGDRFNIIQFSSNSRLWKDSLVPVNKENIMKAQRYTAGMNAGGSTNINDALHRGIELLNDVEDDNQRIKLIIFLTDGMADQPRDLILKNVQKSNTQGIAIFSLGFGNNADYTFIKKLALKNKGIARKIFEDSDASLQIKGFYDEISSASLKNLTFKYLNKEEESIVENATQRNFNAFFNGKELVIAGKLADNEVKVVDLVVIGNGIDGDVELTLESDVESGIPELTKAGDYAKITERIWAYMTIKQLLEDAIGASDQSEKKDLNDKALDLSLKYKFVTPLTSMVVTKPEESDIGALDEDEDAQLALAQKFSGQAGQAGQPGQAGFSSTPYLRTGIRGPSIPSYNSISGGGGGDPHFMVKINGLDLPICFNIHTTSGQVLKMLDDPITGITINADIVASRETQISGDSKTFIGKLVLVSASAIIEVQPHNILFNGAALSWDDHHVFNMGGIEIKIKNFGHHDRVMTINYGDVVVKVRRHMKEDTKMAMSYLNLYIDREDGISGLASGILGELVHKSTRLVSVTTDKRGRQHGHFLESGKGGSFRMYTTMIDRPDIITGHNKQCWFIHKVIHHLLEKDIESYFA